MTIPTYTVGKPDKNPMFLEKRVYQGSSGVVYPYPVIESIADENIPTAGEEIESREMSESVRRNIANLPEKQRKVIEGYYFQEKKLGEIAKDFGLTEARICQIHSQALNALRPKFVN